MKLLKLLEPSTRYIIYLFLTFCGILGLSGFYNANGDNYTPTTPFNDYKVSSETSTWSEEPLLDPTLSDFTPTPTPTEPEVTTYHYVDHGGSEDVTIENKTFIIRGRGYTVINY